MSQPDPAPAGTLEELREIAVEQLDLVRFHSDLAVAQGTVSADAGMFYNARRAVAHMRMATLTLKMMHERQAREAREADERRADHGLAGRERRGERL